MNRVTIIGRIGQNPELKLTESGKSVCTMSLATSEKWTDEKGEKHEKTEWHRIVVWGKSAENCVKYLEKGKQVCVEGKLQTRSWEDPEGNKKYVTEIVASSVEFLGSSNNGVPAPSDDDAPFYEEESEYF